MKIIKTPITKSGFCKKYKSEKLCAGQNELSSETTRTSVDSTLKDTAPVDDTAKEKSEQLKTILGELTHSFRMPLSIIIGYAELLEQRYAPSDSIRQHYIEKILEHSRGMNDRLSALVTAARLDSDVEHYKLVKTPVDIVSVLKTIAEDMESIIRTEGLRIWIESEYSSIYVEADSIQMMKIFYNLVDNTLKYKGRKTDIWITVAVDSPGQLLIVFRDEGMGLPSDEVEHIFESDFQGSNQKGEGSGFGLYHAYRTVKAHGGEIFAKGDIGKGLGIYIRIPIGDNPGGYGPLPVRKVKED
jgi:signal transduction histidine kinase